MPRRIKTLLIMETVALAGTVTWILILLFGVELPPSPYQSVNTCPDVTFRMITPYISILNQASTFELANTGGDPYAYGNDFRLEARIDGVWRVIPHDGWAIEDIGYGISPYGISHFTPNWESIYGEQLPGTYRILTEIRNMRTGQYFLVAAEFEIPA